jgi:hypothetical protein
MMSPAHGHSEFHRSNDVFGRRFKFRDSHRGETSIGLRRKMAVSKSEWLPSFGSSTGFAVNYIGVWAGAPERLAVVGLDLPIRDPG